MTDAQQAWPKRKRGPLSEASKEKERARNRYGTCIFDSLVSVQAHTCKSLHFTFADVLQLSLSPKCADEPRSASGKERR